MKAGGWNDGYSLDRDPRGEDPLYYYLKDSDWDSAIGFEIDPPYGERQAASVTIRVFSRHRAREASMESGTRKVMYQRVIPCLVARHRRWQYVTLESGYFDEVTAGGDLARALCDLGFCDGNGGPARGPIWRRTVSALMARWRRRWSVLQALVGGSS